LDVDSYIFAYTGRRAGSKTTSMHHQPGYLSPQVARQLFDISPQYAVISMRVLVILEIWGTSHIADTLVLVAGLLIVGFAFRNTFGTCKLP